MKEEVESAKYEIQEVKKVIKEEMEKGGEVIKKSKKYLNLLPEYLRDRVLAAIVLIPAAIFLIYSPAFIFNTMLILAAILMSYEWNTIMNKKENVEAKWNFYGLAYIGIPLASLMFIKTAENGSDIILWLFLIVWITDIAALITGKTFGGPKLAPTISPNKTWSGSTGGVVASMFIGFLSSLIFNETAVFFIFFAAFISAIEQCGDLVESKFKRYFGVKDSGNIIPGHGGLMDRIDGLTFVAPVMAIVVLFSKNIF